MFVSLQLLLKQSPSMIYRNFGNSGLKVSVISMGQLLNFAEESRHIDEQLIKTCLSHGINHFDTAEIYSKGEAQKQLGRILKKLQVLREDIVISTKILTSPEPDINSQMAINRKHIHEGLKASLKRLQLDYVDVVYAHLYDQSTPLEQICRGFHEVIQMGLSFYWATSNWSAEEVINALAICQKYKLHKPIGTQSYYNMLNRAEMQVEYLKLFREYKYGFIAWSPLAGGYLTGKYLEQNASQAARYNNPQLAKFKEMFFNPIHNQKNIQNLKQVRNVAKKLGYDLVQLALAWAIKYQFLNSLVIGPKNIQQLNQCLSCIKLVEVLTPQIQAKITKIIDNNPATRINFRTWQPFPPVRLSGNSISQ